jgi:hypothetical protein
MSATNDRSVKIQFPEDIIEIIAEWASSIERGGGVCLLCGRSDPYGGGVYTWYTHDYSAGWSHEQPERHP